VQCRIPVVAGSICRNYEKQENPDPERCKERQERGRKVVNGERREKVSET